MSTFHTIISVLLAGITAFILGKHRSGSKRNKGGELPKNKAASAANDNLQESFDEEIDRIQSDLKGDDPAGDLASRGNARRRS
mgnify:CR=1 FL=1